MLDDFAQVGQFARQLWVPSMQASYSVWYLVGKTTLLFFSRNDKGLLGCQPILSSRA